MYDVMYNSFFNKKSFFSLFFIFIFFNVFSQNLNKKINDNPKFLKLIELSKNIKIMKILWLYLILGKIYFSYGKSLAPSQKHLDWCRRWIRALPLGLGAVGPTTRPDLRRLGEGPKTPTILTNVYKIVEVQEMVK